MLSGTATITDYQTALESVAFSTTSPNTGTPRSTIDWTVSDSASTSAQAPSTVDVVNGPVVSVGANPTVTYTEGGGVVALDPGLTIIDTATTTLASATVTITNAIAGDTLNFTNQNNITGSYIYNSGTGTGVLTLTGTDTVADYTTALESISFSTTSTSIASRTIDWVVNDGTLNSTTANSTVDVVPATAATTLVVTTSDSTVTYEQGGPAVTVNYPYDGITITDNGLSTGDLASATVTVSTNFQSGDVLGFASGDLSGTTVLINGATTTNITIASYTGGVLTLTGTDTIANYQAVLSEVTFSSTASPLSIVPRTITFSATDGSGVSGSAIDTVDIQDQPVVTAGATATFDGGGSAVALDPGLTVTDASTTMLASATVTLSAGTFTGGTDVLGIPTADLTGSTIDGTSITVVGYDSTTHVLTLSGTDTVADYQTALREVTYDFTGDPTNAGANPTRTITWSVTDADSLTSAAGSTSTIDVFGLPTVTNTGNTVTFDQNGSAVAVDDGTNPITVNDPNGADITTATVTVSSGYLSGDTLSFNGGTNTQTFGDGSIITATQSGDALTLTTSSGNATASDYTTALESVTYSFSGDPTNAGANPTRTITWSVTDADSLTSAAGSTSTIDVFGLPTVTNTGNTVTFDQNGSAVAVDDGTNPITVNDPNGADITTATVTVSSGYLSGDTLSFNGGTNTQTFGDGSIITATQSGDALTLTTSSGNATASDYTTALESVTYSFSGDPTNAGANPTRTITWSVTDADSLTSAAGSTSTIDVFGLPTVTNTGNTVTFDQNGSAVAVDDGTNPITVNDPNGADITTATVTVSSGYLSGDTLSFNGGTNTQTFGDGSIITATQSGDALTLTTSSGNATASDYTTALESVTYSFSGDPTNAGANPTRTITWSVTDADSLTSAAGSTSTIDVFGLPTVTNTGNTVTFDQNGSAVAVDDGTNPITVNDPNGADITTATVTVSSGYLSGDTLSFNGGTNTQTFGDGSIITATQSGDALTLTTSSGNATASDYTTALESVTYSFSGDPTNAGANPTRTITWSVTDADSLTSAAGNTSTIDVFGLPTVTNTGNTVTFDQNGSAVAVDSAITVTDPNGADITTATVTISSSFLSGDTLSFNGGTNTQTFGDGSTITATQSGDVLTLTTTAGSATATDYQKALESVTYSFSGDPTNAGANPTRTITWSVTDADSLTSAAGATSTIDVEHAPPVVTVGTPSVTFTGGGGPVTLDSGIAVTDVISTGNLTGATVTISVGTLQPGDVLSFNGTNTETFSDHDTISATFSGGVLTLTGTATVADYQTALSQVQYSFNSTVNGGTDVDPTAGGTDLSRSITWQVSDSESQSSTAGATTTLTVVHVAPSVTAGAAIDYPIGDSSTVPLDGGLTVSDPDSGGNLTGATVSIGTGFVSGDDTLSFTAQTGITGSYDAGTGVLTLRGSASVTSYQSVLNSVTFSTTATSPGLRTIAWTASDDVSTSAQATSTVDVVFGPVVTAGATVTFDGGGAAVLLDNGLTVTDSASTTLASATVTIGTGNISGDTLTINGTTSGTLDSGAISYSFTGSSLTLTGTDTVAEYQAALRLVNYSFTSGGDPTGGGGDTTRTIDWAVNDGVVPVAVTATSTLDTVHVAPTVTPSGTTPTFDGGGAAVLLDSGLTVNDVDSGGNLTGATVTISSGYLTGDTLSVASTVLNGTNITVTSFDPTTHKLVLSGTDTLANYQSVLDSITYSFNPSDGDPTNGGTDPSRSISWVVTDGSSSNGSSTTATSTLDTLHTAPIVTAGGAATYEIGSSAVALDSTLTVTDADSLGNLTGATVSIGTGFLQGDDALTFINQNGITGSYDAVHGVLTLTGSATVADYQAALESITFNTTTTNFGTRTIDWTVSDSVSSSIQTTSTVVVEFGPQVTAGATASFKGGGAAATLDGTLIVADQSKPDLQSATVTITSGLITGDTLSADTTGTGITASYSNGVLKLTGSDTLADYQQVLDSVTYSFNPSNGDPTGGGGDTSRTITWVANDGAPNLIPATSTLERRACAADGEGGSQRDLRRRRRGGGARRHADAERSRQFRQSDRRHGDRQFRLPQWRYIEFHQHGQHHRQLQCNHRRADAERHRHTRALSGGA